MGYGQVILKRKAVAIYAALLNSNKNWENKLSSHLKIIEIYMLHILQLYGSDKLINIKVKYNE